MKKSIAFTVPGRPQSKERPRKGQHGNFYTPKRTRDAEKAIALQCLSWSGMFTGPVRVSCVFHTGNKKLDGDNAFKLVADALQQAGVYADDRQIKRGLFEIVDDDEERTDVVVEDLQ